MKRFVLSLFLPLALAPLGCDRDDDDDAAVEQDRTAEQSDASAKSGHRSPVDKLCALVSCTDEQRTELTALVPARAPGDKPDEAAHGKANAALADSFRSDSFSAAALVSYRSAVPDRHGRPRFGAETIIGVHDILTAPQRDVLADVLEAKGPGALLGKGGKHFGKGDKAGKRDKGDKGDKGDKAGKRGGDHAQRFAAELCERIACEDAQAQSIAAALADAKPTRPQESAADQAFAAAFRGEELDARTVSAYLAGIETTHQAQLARRDAAIVAVHDLLNAEQRGVLADEIAEQGMRALMPERRHKGGEGKRGKAGRGPVPA